MTKTSQIGANQPWKPWDIFLVNYDHSEIHRDQFRKFINRNLWVPMFHTNTSCFSTPTSTTTHPPTTTGNTRTIQAAIQAAKDAQLDAAEFAKAATKELIGLIASKGL